LAQAVQVVILYRHAAGVALVAADGNLNIGAWLSQKGAEFHPQIECAPARPFFFY
jgi:hypothetical protein